MKLTFVIVAAAMALSASAHAQSPANAPPSDGGTGYVEVVGHSAFGNVTSQSFGVEGGVTVAPRLTLFAEIGWIRDTAPSEVGVAAQQMAGHLSAVQSASVGYSVRQPVTFGVAGLAYIIPVESVFQPYVLGGFGFARYTRDISFTVGGTDVTANIGDYGIALGADLAGSYTKPMLTAGGGVAWTFRSPFILDFQYRYGRIFASGKGINVSRAGLGIGIQF
jgi:opacity protein-like surface antigen